MIYQIHVTRGFSTSFDNIYERRVQRKNELAGGSWSGMVRTIEEIPDQQERAETR